MDYYAMLRKLLSKKRHCQECGCIETANNILLKYDCGKLLFDKCFIKLCHIEL